MAIVHDPDELEYMSRRDAPPPPPGYRYTLDGRLVTLAESRLDLETLEAQAIFCEVLEVTGSLRAACDSCGIRDLRSAKTMIEKYPDFAIAAEAAADRHRQKIYAAAVQRATVGYEVPIIGGKDKDQIVAYERRYSDSILALLLKRHFPEFREASKGTTVNVNQPTVNVNMPDMKKVPYERRQQLKALLKEPPKIIDTTATDDTKEN